MDATKGRTSLNYNIVDLFSGAGGLHMGFEAAGFSVEMCVDSNELVERTHKRNFPSIPFMNKDISQITSEDILSGVDSEIDLVIGGPPCQGFSTIGNRVSSDPEKRMRHDKRNELVLAYVKIIQELQPKFIVMENVKGILTRSNGVFLETVLNELKKANYNVGYQVVNMADYGVPQIRERVIILGNRMGLPVKFPPADHAEKPYGNILPWRNCWEVISDLEGLCDDSNFNHVALRHTPKIIERYRLIPEGGRLPEDELPEEIFRRNFGNTYKRLHRKRPALTMVPGNDAFPIHPTLNRSLTVREAARIQTFSDDIIFEGNRRQQGHQVGNAVPPMFSTKLAQFIKTQLDEYYSTEDSDCECN
jgi:DNA (cytosine-5)-methyltransferase 1